MENPFSCFLRSERKFMNDPVVEDRDLLFEDREVDLDLWDLIGCISSVRSSLPLLKLSIPQNFVYLISHNKSHPYTHIIRIIYGCHTTQHRN